MLFSFSGAEGLRKDPSNRLFLGIPFVWGALEPKWEILMISLYLCGFLGARGREQLGIEVSDVPPLGWHDCQRRLSRMSEGPGGAVFGSSCFLVGDSCDPFYGNGLELIGYDSGRRT